MKEFTDTELANEQWRDVDGYDGMYQVSDLGRVRSRKSGEWKVLMARNNGTGYLLVSLYMNGKQKQYYIHRLVAQAFIQNDDDTKNQINHINEIKSDNRLWNLEYCTAQYNMTYNNLPFRKKNSKRLKIKDLYDPNLSIKQNLELFRAKGVECSKRTVVHLRRDLKLDKPKTKRDKIRPLYNPELSINENIKAFKEQGIECSRNTVKRLRRELGLTKQIE